MTNERMGPMAELVDLLGEQMAASELIATQLPMR